MKEYKFPPLTGKWLPPQNPIILEATIEDQEEFIKNTMFDSDNQNSEIQMFKELKKKGREIIRKSAR